MTRTAPLALAAVLLAATAHAQAPFADPANLRGERPAPRTGRELPIDQGARGLQQLLRKLSTRASIMNIVAHPDDEDGGMLTLYSRGLGARVADLSLTRGEGGQNAMTGDFEDALGLLRTQELLSNDRFVGVDQFFGTEVDFGFSKTKAESFSKWTHERVLYDVVRAIRLYRPLVLTSTWIGAATDGHGQHQVSGEITQEAFLAAGDPRVFPELTAEGILPWQPLRVYARVPMSSITPKGLYDYATNQYIPAEFTNYVTHQTTETPPSTDITVHEGTVDPLLSAEGEGPVSYVQFARRGLAEQRSQIGPGVRLAPPGEYDVQYHLFGSRICATGGTPSEVVISPPKTPCLQPVAPRNSEEANGFFDGMDTSILGIGELDPEDFPADLLSSVSKAISEANKHFDPSKPEATAPILALAIKPLEQTIQALEAGTRGTPTARASALHELRIKQSQLNDALALSLGLTLDATTSDENIVTRSPVTVHFTLHETSNTPLTLLTQKIDAPHADNIASELAVSANQLTVDHPIERDIQLKPEMATTITRPYFTRESIEAPVYKLTDAIYRSAPASPPALIVTATVGYKSIPITLSRIVHSGSQAISIVPPASLSLPLHAQVIPRSEHSFFLTLNTRAIDPQVGSQSAVLDLPTRWEADLSLAPLGHDSTTFHISFPAGALQHTESITAKAILPDAHILEGLRPVGYGDLPRTNLYAPATDRIVPADLKLPAKRRIGYLPGTGDAVPEALASIGLSVTTLAIDDLTPAILARYDTVILGVRTYSAHPDLHGTPTAALLDFARNGGNVLVQYQTTEFTAADAPYPLSLGDNEKVVDETAPVALLAPKSPLLTTPNIITPADFNGWIEERGHGFLGTWDPQYTALTETRDPGAPEEHVAPQHLQRGGLITVQLGKGRWTYCAFALYRQLPEAVPGAYRLFTNLITP